MAKNFIIEGRLVKGHPLVRREVTDEITKRPVLNQDGTHKTNIYLAVAIPKNGNQDIWSTPFGLAMYEEAVSGWPNREWQSPTFAWKYTDGDSLVPNTVGKVPASQEGYPGHWVIHCKTEFTVKCYYPGKYDPMYQIVDAQAIKTGDYCRVSVTCRANNPSKKPGLYMNPELFELSGVGAAIYSGPDPNQAFGGTSATLPAGVPAAGGMPGMPPAGMPGMPPAGMPGMPPAGMPGMPPAGMPGMPPAGMPGMPPAGMPGMPPAGMPGMPPAGMPGMPPAGMPGMPPAGMPGMPPAGMPGMPPAGMPGMPPAGMPGMPPAGMPGMPPAGMPGMPPAPAHDFVDPTLNESIRIGSATYTRAQLQGWGWTEAQIIAYPRA